jgi:hypothetical protein
VSAADPPREHPGWEIWQSRRSGGEPSGIFYATPAHHDSPAMAVTLTADSMDGLDKLITGQEEFWCGLAPAPPSGYLTGLAIF